MTFAAPNVVHMLRLLRSERKNELLRAARNCVQEAFDLNNDAAQNLRLREILKLLYQEIEETSPKQEH